MVDKGESGGKLSRGAFSPPMDGERGAVIHPPRGWPSPGLSEVWQHRHLLYLFVWRDLKSRYKQTLVGPAWALIQPLLTMVVLSIFFGKLARIPSDGLPYPIFAYCALVPWTYFANALTQSSNSVVSHHVFITRVYFPRLIIPISTVITGLLDFFIAFVILLVMMLFYGIVPTVAICLLPIFVLLAMGTALGIGFWLAAINVEYRDVAYTLPFVTQVWLFATPIAYSSSLVPDKWRALYGLNPMAGVVEGFRWALLGTGKGPGAMFGVSLLVAALLLVSGWIYFRYKEDAFVDVV